MGKLDNYEWFGDVWRQDGNMALTSTKETNIGYFELGCEQMNIVMRGEEYLIKALIGGRIYQIAKRPVKGGFDAAQMMGVYLARMETGLRKGIGLWAIDGDEGKVIKVDMFDVGGYLSMIRGAMSILETSGDVGARDAWLCLQSLLAGWRPSFEGAIAGKQGPYCCHAG